MNIIISIRRAVIVTSVCFVIGAQASAQGMASADSLPLQHRAVFAQKLVTYRSFILPVSFMAAGALEASGHHTIDTRINAFRNRNFGSFHTTADNYLQFLPIVAGYGFLINNHEHRFWKYTEKVVLTEVVVTGLTQGVKHLAKRPRPDTGAPNSFPSGHTAEAFAGATIFADEFAQHNTWLAITAYTSASAVGVLRVLNNRHWASDVLAGAGFGILSAKLSELIIEPHGRQHRAQYTYQF